MHVRAIACGAGAWASEVGEALVGSRCALRGWGMRARGLRELAVVSRTRLVRTSIEAGGREEAMGLPRKKLGRAAVLADGCASGGECWARRMCLAATRRVGGAQCVRRWAGKLGVRARPRDRWAAGRGGWGQWLASAGGALGGWAARLSRIIRTPEVKPCRGSAEMKDREQVRGGWTMCNRSSGNVRKLI